MKTEKPQALSLIAELSQQYINNVRLSVSCIRFIGLIFLFRLQRYDKEMTFAAAVKERSGFIGDNLRKNSIFAPRRT